MHAEMVANASMSEEDAVTFYMTKEEVIQIAKSFGGIQWHRNSKAARELTDLMYGQVELLDRLKLEEMYKSIQRAEARKLARSRKRMKLDRARHQAEGK